nr:type IV pili methyl-accepting chemotaxis transducer N-terminal domain-containing protein [uncultured Ralstonia sp.]
MKRHLHSSRLLVCVALLMGRIGSACAQALTINSAINKAGRQRMLSQRMAKA